MTINRIDLIAYLADEFQPRCEPGPDGSIIYYVHISEDGCLVDSVDKAEITVTAELDVSSLPSDSTMEAVYAKEREDDPDFRRMVDDLLPRVQAALDELMI